MFITHFLLSALCKPGLCVFLCERPPAKASGLRSSRVSLPAVTEKGIIGLPDSAPECHFAALTTLFFILGFILKYEVDQYKNLTK